MALATQRHVPGHVLRTLLLVILVALLGALMALALATDDARASPDPPAAGDWTIGPGEDVTKASETITIAGNLTVRSGGRLTLTDCDLRLDMPKSGAYHVRVEAGGELVLDGGTAVDSTDVDMYYNITVLGRASIGPATIRRLDGTVAPTPLTDPPGGLLLRSSGARLHNTTIELSRGFAIAVDPPSMLTSVHPVIEDCVVRGNGGGIYCEGLILASGDPLVRRTHFYGNTNGEALVIAAAPRFDGCTFGQLLSFSLMGVSAVALAEPVLTGCTFQYLGAAIASVMASPTVDGCAVSWCAAGAVVLGGSPTVTRTTFTNCVATMMLNSTTAVVMDCRVTGFATIDHAISIDAGAPTLHNVTVDLDLIGGAISIVNGSSALIDECDLIGPGTSDMVLVDGSTPKIRGCTVQGGVNGISLSWSEAILENNDILGNSRWGIMAAHRAPEMSGNIFGTGAISNGLGSVLQLYQLKVTVELSEGAPAAGASLVVTDALDQNVADTVADAGGVALDALIWEYSIDEEGVRYDKVPYSLEAQHEGRSNRTFATFDGADRELVVILWPNLAPTAKVLFPLEGAELNAWDYRSGIPLEGAGDDPEGDALSATWTLDEGVIEGAASWCATIRPLTGQHTVAIAVDDGHGHVSRASVSFSVTSVPPVSNGVNITTPADGSGFDTGEWVHLSAEVHVEDDPYSPGTAALTVSWSSDVVGLLGSGMELTTSALPYGTHVITATVSPTRPEWVPSTYSDTITILIRPPKPVAVAVFASPVDGFTTREDLRVNFSATGSYVQTWEDLQFVTFLTWHSSIDGLLGLGENISISGLSVGLHRITLELTTEPPIASANASITIGIFPGPPPNFPPVAVAALASEGRLYAGDPVNFTANGSLDPDGDALMFTWDFGDGNTSTGRDVNHTYARVGTYNVTLSVTDGRATTNATVAGVLIEARKGPPPPPSDGDGDGGDHSTNEDVTGCIVLVLLVTVLVALLVLTFRRRGHRA